MAELVRRKLGWLAEGTTNTPVWAKAISTWSSTVWAAPELVKVSPSQLPLVGFGKALAKRISAPKLPAARRAPAFVNPVPEANSKVLKGSMVRVRFVSTVRFAVTQ